MDTEDLDQPVNLDQPVHLDLDQPDLAQFGKNDNKKNSRFYKLQSYDCHKLV